MRKVVESEGSVLGSFLFDWAIIHKTADALTGVRGGCINVKFYSEISCSDFDSCGEILENNYAKNTQSR